MDLETTIFGTVLALLLTLAFSAWRSASSNTQEFFPSQRARAVGAVRLRVIGIAVVALGALSVQYSVGRQRLAELDQKEERLLQNEADLLRLRVQYQLARRQSEPNNLVVAAAKPAPAAASQARSAAEVAQVSVQRAVVRDSPAGRAQFTLTGGARVRLSGEPSHGSGRLWREAYTDDGRHGWIAAEVLSDIKG